MNKELSRERFLRDCKDLFRDCYIELKDKKIVLFGAGSYGKLMIMGLKDIGMYDNICALCDNDKKKWGGKIREYINSKYKRCSSRNRGFCCHYFKSV